MLIWLGVQIVAPSIVLGQERVAEKAIGEGGLFPCCRVASSVNISNRTPSGVLEDGKTEIAEHGGNE